MQNLTESLLARVASAMVLLSLVFMITPSFAFDMDAALEIYQAEQQPQQYQEYQEVQQAPAPQQHSREYYQQRWLEQQQGQAAQQPTVKDQQAQHSQATPEADDLFMAAVNGNNQQIGRLLAQGLDVNISNPERETALHMAAARGHYSTVIYLINNGAYPTARTIKNWLPLHHAVRFRHHNIANFLMKRGSSANERTSDGLSAIDMARNVNDYRLMGILGGR